MDAERGGFGSNGQDLCKVSEYCSVSQQWLTEPSSDLTNRDAVTSAFKTISATMPPIAGVAQGAMVLRDTMFADMTVEHMEKVLKPKVQGSIYLDDIFRDVPLDWFVFFSSIACITGNPGQSMYAAANMFMNSLAAQRRKRGAAASSVEIGAIMGNGYVTRELTLQQQAFLHQVGNTWMSEQDFLVIFAEAVLASAPSSPETVETATGLRLQYGDEKITWFSNPMFQHLVLKTGTAVSSKAGSKNGVSVKTQLLEAKTAEEVFELLKGMLPLDHIILRSFEFAHSAKLHSWRSSSPRFRPTPAETS